MYGFEGLAIIVSAIQLYASLSIYRTNGKRKSIKGLSFDYIFLSCFGYMMACVSGLFYLFNKKVQEQYMYRFPVFGPISFSMSILWMDILGLGINLAILYQTHAYKDTKCDFQYISAFPKILIFIIVLSSLYILKECQNPYSKVFLLDLVDFWWLCSRLFSSIKLFPQAFINWFSSSYNNISKKFILYESISLLLLFFLRSYLTFNVPFYKISSNINGWLYLTIYSLPLLLLAIQKKIIYKRKRHNIDSYK